MAAAVGPAAAQTGRFIRQRSFARLGYLLAATAAAATAPAPASAVTAAVPPDQKISFSESSSSMFGSRVDNLPDENLPFVVKGLRQQHGQQEQHEKRLAVVVPVSDAVTVPSRIAGWRSACPDSVPHAIELVFFLDNEEARTRFNHEADFGPHSSGSELQDTGDCFQASKAVVGDTIFEIFTDKSVRQQFEEYDAIAVIDWERIEVQEGGFERLYHAAFRQKQSQHSWWIMASDARPLDVAEARERRRHVEENNLGGSGGDGADGGGNYGQQLVWTINGKAVIYNNRSRGLRRFFTYDVSPSLYSLPFDMALWATFSFMPIDGWRRIAKRIVSIDYLVVSSDPDQVTSASNRPIFLDTTTTGAHDDEFSATTGSSGGGGGGIPLDQQGETRPYVVNAGTGDEQEMYDKQEREEEEEDRWEVLGQALARPQPLASAGWDLFTEDLARESLCVFVPGYLHQRPYAEVTVESVLRFMPGVRVALAVDPSEMDDYQRAVGSLPGVRVTRSIDVKYSAVTADLRCGDDTELVLYLEPGAVLSRPFTKVDTHDVITDELFVVYTEAARAGLRHETFARSAGEMLGAENLPAFTAGTDLILPVSANQDLRETLMLPESVAADWRIHSHAINHNCFESEVHVPQILASVAFMAGRPGVVFAPVIPKRREADQTETRFDSADSSESHVQPMTLKPRFGCQFYTEMYYAYGRRVPLVLGNDDLISFDDGEQIAVQALRAALGRFDNAQEEACVAGWVRLPWPALVSPDGLDGLGVAAAGGGEGSEPTHDESYAPASKLPAHKTGSFRGGFGSSELNSGSSAYQRDVDEGVAIAAAAAAAAAGAAGAGNTRGARNQRHHAFYTAVRVAHSDSDFTPAATGADEEVHHAARIPSSDSYRYGNAGATADLDSDPAGSPYSDSGPEGDEGRHHDLLSGGVDESAPSRSGRQEAFSEAAAAAVAASLPAVA